MAQMTRMDRHKKEEQLVEHELPQKEKKPKKVKRKKRRGFFFYLFLILIIILLGSGIGYAKGYFSAKADQKNAPKQEIEFNGQPGSNGRTNVLILGSDSRGEDQGRADTIMVASYSTHDKTPKLMSIMRDTYVSIPMDNQEIQQNKINAAYAFGGAEKMRQTITNNFGIPIQYYAVVNFKSFPIIIDTLVPSGLSIDAEKTLDVEGTTIQQGPQKLNGNQALAYARFRKDEEGDFGRVRRQQQVMTAIMKDALKPTNLWRVPEVTGTALGYTDTNIPFTNLSKISASYLFSKHQPMEILTVPVKDSYVDSYYDHAGSVLEINAEQNKQAIQNFLQ